MSHEETVGEGDTACMERAGRKGQPSTACSPGHQASPQVIRQVCDQAGKQVHGSGSVCASAGCRAKHRHGCGEAIA